MALVITTRVTPKELINYNVADGALTENKWQHIVFSVEGTTIRVYVDGTSVLSDDLGDIAVDFPYFTVGGNRLQGNLNSLDGYLSDAYFVEAALTPDVFGKLFDGKWGPLDSSVIEQNIGGAKKPPLPPGNNKDEDWVSRWSGTLYGGGYSFSHVHDQNVPAAGDAATSSNCALPASSEVLTFTPASPIQVRESVVLRASSGGGNDAAGIFFVNEGTANEFVSNGTADLGSGLRDIVIPASAIGGQVETIHLYARGPGGERSGFLAAIFVDGRYLETGGPSISTQVWSDFLTTDGTWDPDRLPPKAFGGGVDTLSTASTEGDASYILFDITDTPLAIGTGIQIFAAGNGNTPDVILNDTVTAATLTTAFAQTALTTGTETQLRTLRINGSSGIGQVRVNGYLLMDAGASWNTSQVWSTNSETSTPDTAFTKPVERAFNGDTTTGTTVSPTIDFPGGEFRLCTGTFTFPQPLENVTKLRVWMSDYSNDSSSKNEKVAINGGTPEYLTAISNSGAVADNVKKWLDLSALLAGQGGTFSSITFGREMPTAIYGGSLFAIEVNGEILVDGGSFGANGFYLPFEADEPSIEVINDEGWAEVTTITASPVLNNGALIGYSSTPIVWSCSADVPGSGVQWYTSNDGIEWIYQGTANDGAFNATFESVPVKWICAGGSGTNSRTIAGKNGETFKWTQWTTDDRFDKKQSTSTPGVLAAKYNSIGLDASGQGNHFLDKNFAVGNTDEVWSKLINGTDVQTVNQMFNGNLNDSGYGAVNTPVTFAADLGNITSLQVLLRPYGSSISGDVTVTGTGITTTVIAAADTMSIQDIQLSGGPVSNVTFTIDNGSGFTNDISAIIVDGAPLIDKNIQDTVLDTPMDNYAVLETGKNGNLVMPPNANVSERSTVLTTKPFYFEAQCSGEVNSGNLYSIAVANEAKTIYGVQGGGAIYLGSPTGENAGVTYDNELIGVACDPAAGKVTYYKEGTFLYTLTNLPTNQALGARGGLNASATKSITFNMGQQPFAASNVTHDIDAGTVMLDVTPPNMAEKKGSNYPS